MSRMLNGLLPEGFGGSGNTRKTRFEIIGGTPRNITERRRSLEKAERDGRIDKLLVETELEALRYQINPHFLFNVMNSLSALAKTSSDRTDRLIMQISCYLRSILSASDSGFTSLRKELDSTEIYLEIEKARFGENLLVAVKSPPEVLEVEVPELILQPIVENGVRYGMRTSLLPLRIDIEGWVGEDMVFVKVVNTGRWVSREETTGGRKSLGIENVLKRLELHYGDHYRFVVEEGDGRVSVTVGIPLDRGSIFLSPTKAGP